MVMVRRANDHRIQVLHLVNHLAVVFVGADTAGRPLRLLQNPHGVANLPVVAVGQGNNLKVRNPAEARQASIAHAAASDQRHVDLVQRGNGLVRWLLLLLSSLVSHGKARQRSGGGGSKKSTAVHEGFLEDGKRKDDKRPLNVGSSRQRFEVQGWFLPPGGGNEASRRLRKLRFVVGSWPCRLIVPAVVFPPLRAFSPSGLVSEKSTV